MKKSMILNILCASMIITFGAQGMFMRELMGGLAWYLGVKAGETLEPCISIDENASSAPRLAAYWAVPCMGALVTAGSGLANIRSAMNGNFSFSGACGTFAALGFTMGWVRPFFSVSPDDYSPDLSMGLISQLEVGQHRQMLQKLYERKTSVLGATKKAFSLT